jgi:hypothetical protein
LEGTSGIGGLLHCNASLPSRRHYGRQETGNLSSGMHEQTAPVLIVVERSFPRLGSCLEILSGANRIALVTATRTRSAARPPYGYSPGQADRATELVCETFLLVFRLCDPFLVTKLAGLFEFIIKFPVIDPGRHSLLAHRASRRHRRDHVRRLPSGGEVPPPQQHRPLRSRTADARPKRLLQVFLEDGLADDAEPISTARLQLSANRTVREYAEKVLFPGTTLGPRATHQHRTQFVAFIRHVTRGPGCCGRPADVVFTHQFAEGCQPSGRTGQTSSRQPFALLAHGSS